MTSNLEPLTETGTQKETFPASLGHGLMCCDLRQPPTAFLPPSPAGAQMGLRHMRPGAQRP